MFARADNDQSPNAHACRLKLMSGVLFSLNEVCCGTRMVLVLLFVFFGFRIGIGSACADR
jgi:hypothetical protein